MTTRALTLISLTALSLFSARRCHAQLPVTREQAAERALAGGSRTALARADSAAAVAKLLTARAIPNPVLVASYSKATPQKHIAAEFPVFDALFTRGARVAQASASVRASRLLYASERNAAIVEIDTTYTVALAAAARLRLSRQNAVDADSLRKMSIARRAAGDVSDLEVDLATVVAGQAFNTVTDDSLAYQSALLTVQTLMGVAADSVSVVLVDSLALPSAGGTPVTAEASGDNAVISRVPSVTAAEATLSASELGIGLQRRSVFPLPSLSVGMEFGDPSGAEPGLLPTIGISVPLSLFNRNQGPIAEATAERDRARVELSAARLEARRRLLEAVRERDALTAKIARDVDLAALAQRVATLSLTAYREGASALPAVLEARRNAREVQSKYIDDLSSLLIVLAELRGLTPTAP